jgi:hypothetical protein
VKKRDKIVIAISLLVILASLIALGAYVLHRQFVAQSGRQVTRSLHYECQVNPVFC